METRQTRTRDARRVGATATAAADSARAGAGGRTSGQPISRRRVLRAALGLAAAAAGVEALDPFLRPVVRLATAATAPQNVVVTWNAVGLAATTATQMGVTPASRALAIVHTCMYDAWTTYDPRAVPTLANGIPKAVAQGSAAHKARAVSYAAYRALLDLLPTQAALFARQMRALGYNPADTSTDVTTPAGVGNVAAWTVLASRRNDGANQANGYADDTAFPQAYADYPPGYPATPRPRDPAEHVDDDLRP